MFCPHCGTQLPDGSQICQNCGRPALQPPQPEPIIPQPSYYSFCQACGSQISTDLQACPNCGAPAMQRPMSANIDPYAVQKPMKWFKFLIYFALWLGGISTILTGISTMLGLSYASAGADASMVYAIYPLLQPVDLVYGAICIILGCFTIVTRYQLARFRKNALVFLYCMYALNFVIPCIFTIIQAICINISIMQIFTSTLIGQFVGTGVAITLNVIYFNKRRHLFVN